MRRWLTALVLLPAACAGGGGAPRGDPLAVVRAAPDRTFAHAAARVEAAAPDASSAGRVRLADPDARLQTSGPDPGDYPELSQPLALVDLVRGAVEVRPYGGTAVRGASTFRYETVIDVARAVRETPETRRPRVGAFADLLKASSFYADVWVDGRGRLRRVQVPVEKTPRRPGSRERGTPRLITVDLFDFEP